MLYVEVECLLLLRCFFLIGVEEVSYPKGALMFHSEGIAKSMFIFFLCSIPLILLNKENEFFQIFNKKKTVEKTTKEENLYDESLWEEASVEEVNSGEFETI